MRVIGCRSQLVNSAEMGVRTYSSCVADSNDRVWPRACGTAICADLRPDLISKRHGVSMVGAARVR